MVELHLNEVKKIILYPHLIQEEYLNLQMYDLVSGLFPAYLPQIEDATSKTGKYYTIWGHGSTPRHSSHIGANNFNCETARWELKWQAIRTL